jgi:multiple sugar transport system substrate-binding protein
MKVRKLSVFLGVALVVVLAASFVLFAGTGEKGKGGKKLTGELTIFWAEWDPANYLQELCNIFTEETGIIAKVETTPWSDFQTKTFNEFAARGDAYDIVVGDSQWLGRGAMQGHYVELTDWVKERGV